MALGFASRTAGGNTASSSVIASGVQSHAAGSLLVALVQYASTSITISGVASVADGSGWTQAGTLRSSTDNSVGIFYVPSSAGSAIDAVTATFSSATIYRFLTVYEFTGQNTSSPLNTTKFASGIGVSPVMDTASITLSAAEEVIVGFGEYGVGNTSCPAGYTSTAGNCTGDAITYFRDYYHIITASETAQMNGTGGSATWYNFAASFKAAAAGSSIGSYLYRHVSGAGA